MLWNWQKQDWPHFTYDKKPLESLEAHFLQHSGILMGSFEHLDHTDKNELMVTLSTDEAVKTSEIEGEYLNRDSLQSSIRRQFGLETDKHKVPPAEQGIAQLMVDLYRSFKEPLTHKYLFSWHTMVTKGRSDLKDVGHYRTHAEPIQVVSGSVYKPKIHFEAPPSKDVKKEMTHFIRWFNQTQQKRTLSLVRAGIAHLYFVSVHPFEDGNGRIARSLSLKAMYQYLDKPVLIALSHRIEQKKKAYYYALEQANRSNEITAWLVYFAETIIDAQRYTQKHIKFLVNKTKLYDRLRDQINSRQEKVLMRMFQEGLEGFKGGLSAKNYMTISKTSASTTTRDLQDLVAKQALKQTGQRRYARYWLNIEV